MKYLFTLCALLTAIAGFGQGWGGSWESQNPSPNSETYTRLSFLDDQHGFATSREVRAQWGMTLRTRNGGETWEIAGRNSYMQNIQDLDFADTLTGWAILNYNDLICTRDGGKTWREDSTGLPKDSISYKTLKFLNRDVGFALGYTYSRAYIFRTVNGGRTWNRTLRMTGLSNSGQNLMDISFASNQVMVATGSDGLIVKSTDGGATWSTISAPNYTKPTYYNVAFANENLGFIRSYTHILRTTNGGQTWDTASLSPFRYSSRNEMKFVDANQGWISGGRQVALTTDGGQTWSLKTHAEGTNTSTIALPHVFSMTHWIMGSKLGRVFITEDGGNTYRTPNMKTKENMYDVHFSDDVDGWAVGANHTILRTYDGGESWRIVHQGNHPNTPGMAYGLMSVHSFGDTAWAVGPGGLFHTTDGGGTWSIDPNIKGRRVTFVSPRHGWILQDPGPGLLETVDGGLHWTRVNTTLQAWEIQMVNDRSGFISGYGSFAGRAAYTRDGGHTWTAYGFPSQTVSTVCFIDSMIGWMGGAHTITNPAGVISRTTNGGRSWTALGFVSTVDPVEMLSFSDDQHGWCRMGGKLMSTQNGGFTWKEYEGDYQYPTAFHFNPTGRGWFVHDSGGIVLFNEGSVSRASNVLAGTVYERTDANCVLNHGELGMGGRVIRIEPGNHFATTNSWGSYRVRVDSGSYDVSYMPDDALDRVHTQVCPGPGQSQQVVFQGHEGQIRNNVDFAFERRNCPYLNISVGSDRRRPCVPSTTTIRYCNIGFDTARDVVVYIQESELVSLVAASTPYMPDTAANTYKFIIGKVAPNSCGTITLRDSVHCNANATGTVCTKVWMTPENKMASDGGCLETPVGYDGSDIKIRSYCLSDTAVGFIIKNRGAAMAVARKYRIYRNTTMTQESMFQLGAGDSIKVIVPRSFAELASGVMVHIEADQDPNHPFARKATAFDYCLRTMPRPLRSDNFQEDDESPVVDTDCQEIRNSMDPNDKQVSPKGIGSDGNILAETMLEYKIRFQNSGNDTAYQVVIADTLKDVLDLATLEMGVSSHPYTAKVTGAGKPVLMVSFPGIKLVDSIHNEPASHGYFTFRIRPKKNLPLGTRIENQAAITFDFNAPVITNTTLNTLYEPTITNVKPDVRTGKQTTLLARPNPASSQITVVAPRTGTVDVLSLQGKRLRTRRVLAGEQSNISLKDLPPGVYILKQQELTLRIVKE